MSSVRYIEKDLPVDRLNRIAQREGNSKKPIYQLHKWWARRLGSVFRMLIISAFCSAQEPEESIWSKFYEGMNLDSNIILDPFMGGGTTIVEALRLSGKVIGVDINPVAWFITKKEVESVDLSELDSAFAGLEETVGRTIKGFYKTRCPKGHEADIIYTFWVKKVTCPLCEGEVKLFPTYELLCKNGKAILVCPSCWNVFESKTQAKNIACPCCSRLFNPKKGVTKRGEYICPYCGTREGMLNAAERSGTYLKSEMFAIEYYCSKCGKGIKLAEESDLQLYKEAQQAFSTNRDNLLFPSQKIPVEGRSDPRPANHGYKYFWQMFNERQLFCLSLLLEGIRSISDRNVREFMLLAFSDCLDANNMFCKYETGYDKISLLFGLHAYHPIERPTENNVWGCQFGRGSFAKCYEKVRRAKIYGLQSCEGVKSKAKGEKESKSSPIYALLAESFEEVRMRNRSALLLAQSSEDLSFIPTRTVDAVITDPPYFDNIAYSELADFFYVWLRLVLNDDYPWFASEYSYRQAELVENKKLGKTSKTFISGLTRVFKECHRVLKEDGILVFTFHHIKEHAWEQIAKALLNSGFYVSSASVVRSEGKSGFHSSKGNIRYDICFTCRKRNALFYVYDWTDAKSKIIEETQSWIERTKRSGLSLNKVDLFTILMGKLTEYYTKSHPQSIWDSEFLTFDIAINQLKPIVPR